MQRMTRTSLVLLAGALLAGCEKPVANLAKEKLPTVKVSQPTSDYVTDFEDFTGRTDAEFTVTVRARVTGYLDKVYFKDGEEVKKDDMLFEIDPRPYQAALSQSESTVAQNEAHLNRLEADFRRAKNLFSRGGIGREEYDKIAGDRAEAEAALGVAKASRDLAKLNVDYTKIKAPISGRLSRRMIDPGNLVKADDTDMTTIVSLDPMFVYFEIDERTLLGLRRLVREGRVQSRDQGATIKVLVGLSDEDGFPREGTVNYSDNKVDPNTGTLQVRGVLPNPKPRVLSPGLFARVRLPVGIARKALLIPEDVLQSDQGNKYVYIVDDKNTVKRRYVKVGSRQERKEGLATKALRVIEEGLSPSDRFIVSGLQRIKADEVVTPVPLTKTAKAEPGAAPAPTPTKAESKPPVTTTESPAAAGDKQVVSRP